MTTEDLKDITKIWSQILALTEQTDGLDSYQFRFFTERAIPLSLKDDDGKAILRIFLIDRIAYKELEEKESSPVYMYAPLVNVIRSHKLSVRYSVGNDSLTKEDRDNLDLIIPKITEYSQYRKQYVEGERIFEKIDDSDRVGLDNFLARRVPETFKQSNLLTRSFEQLKVQQKKILSYLIWKYQHSDSVNMNLFNEETFNVSVRELKENGCGSNVSAIMSSLLELGKDTWVHIPKPGGDYQEIAVFTMFESCKKKSVNIGFSPYFTALINKLAVYQNYTILNKHSITAISSYAAMRMYELCCQYRFSDRYVFSISDAELRHILKCDGKYTDPSNFKRFVLQAAQKELKELASTGEVDMFFDFIEKSKDQEDRYGEYKRKKVLSWTFLVHRDVMGEAYVEQDSFEDRLKTAEKVFSEILEEFVEDTFQRNVLMDNMKKKLSGKQQIELVRVLQFDLKSLSSDAEKFINSEIRRYAKKSVGQEDTLQEIVMEPEETVPVSTEPDAEEQNETVANIDNMTAEQMKQILKEMMNKGVKF